MPNSLSLILLPLLSLILFICTIFDLLPLLRGPAPWPPEWQWPYAPTPITPTVLIISLLLLTAFFLAIHQTRLRLIPLILLSFLTPLILILQSRAGLGVLVRRIIHPDLNGHFTAALSITSPTQLLSDYPHLVQTFFMHAHGHPPGATLLYQTLINISGSPLLGVYLILLFTLITHIFISILIYLTAKKYTSHAYWLTLLWITTPAVNLFIPLPDLFYTFLSLLSFYLLIQKRFLLSGITFYISLFFSLSTLPALILYFLLSLNAPLTRSQLKSLALGITLPALCLHLLGFDLLTTLSTVLTTQTPRSYHLWLFSNILDFIIYSGAPIWIFMCLKFNQLKQRRHLLLLVIILVLLSLSGFSRAETGRIWMPLMPALIISLSSYTKLNTKTTSLLVLLSITHTIIINLFWVSLW